MKKIILAIFILIVGISINMPVCAENMKDIQAKGEYQAYKQLLNHPYTGLYDIYFKGNDEKAEIQIKELFSKDSDNSLTFKYSDNKSITLTNKQWYDLFNDFEQLKNDENAIEQISGDFFNEWIAFYMDKSPKEIAIKYLKEKRLANEKKNNISMHTEVIDISGVKKEKSKYPTVEKLAKELNSIHNERQMQKVQQGMAMRDYMKNYQNITPEKPKNNTPIGFISTKQLETIGISSDISLKNQRTYYGGSAFLYNKDANKQVYNVYINSSSNLVSNNEIIKNNVRLRYDTSNSSLFFNVEDLINNSIINRLFSKDMNGNYIEMPFIKKSAKENFKNNLKFYLES